MTVDGETLALTAEELVVTETPRSGWAVASAGGETVALDLQLTPELRRAGLVRDAVRLVQDARKNSGLEVSRPDRVVVAGARRGDGAGPARGDRRLSEEVLAVAVTEGSPTSDLRPHADDDLGLTFWLRAAGG